MHDRLLEALLRIAQVRLIASLQSDTLGFPREKDLRIFIPDMHLVSNASAARYRYKTNEETLLLQVIQALTKLKVEAADDETVEVYHIGDYLDLWRENLGPAGPAIPSQIKRDHTDLVNALEARGLRAHFLLGNHDFDLWQWPQSYAAWDRRYYLSSGGERFSVLVMHGDYFDWVEKLPQLVKDFGVFVFGPNVAPNQDILGKMMNVSHDLNKKNDYGLHLQLREPAVVGVGQSAEIVIPPQWNLQKAAGFDQEEAVVADRKNLTFLASAEQECQKANREFGLNMNLVIIGHTHRARIAVGKKNDDGSFFTLMDCGAWIEECRQNDEDDPVLNAQIGVLCDNWARIYQLAPR